MADISVAENDKRILDERWEAGFYPDDGSEPELTSSERRARSDFEAISIAYENDCELGQEVASYGEDRNTDLIADLRAMGGEIEHDGASFSIKDNALSRSKDGQTSEHYIVFVQEGIEIRRSQEGENLRDVVDHLRAQPEGSAHQTRDVAADSWTDYSLSGDDLHASSYSTSFREDSVFDANTLEPKELPAAEQEQSTSWTAVYDAAPETPAQAAAANAAKAIAAAKERQVSQPAIQAKEASL